MVTAADQGTVVIAQRREELERLVQPADRPVLPRRNRRPLPVLDLQRPAGQRHRRRRDAQRLRSADLSRLASRRRRGARLGRSGSGGSRRSSTASGLGGTITRFDTRTGEVRQVVSRGREHVRPPSGAGKPIAGRGSFRSPCRRRRRTPSTPGSQFLLRSPDTGNSWEKASPDLTGAEPGREGLRRARSRSRTPRPCGFGTIFDDRDLAARRSGDLGRHRQTGSSS